MNRIILIKVFATPKKKKLTIRHPAPRHSTAHRNPTFPFIIFSQLKKKKQKQTQRPRCGVGNPAREITPIYSKAASICWLYCSIRKAASWLAVLYLARCGRPGPKLESLAEFGGFVRRASLVYNLSVWGGELKCVFI